MLILVCDTSDKSCCAGVFSGSSPDTAAPIAYEMSLEEKMHSTVFMPMLHRTMQESGFSHEDIDCYAVTTGPGSFTGIRIGVSSVKGMAAVSGKKCIPVSSLAALAESCEVIAGEGIIAACLDARNGRVFCACFDAVTMERLTEDVGIKASEVPETVRGLPESVVSGQVTVCGNGASQVKLAFEAAALSEAVSIDNLTIEYAPGCVITPIGTAKAALRLYSEDQAAAVSADSITPCYCAVSSAERKDGAAAEYIFRKALLSDAPAIAELQKRCMEHPWPQEFVEALLSERRNPAAAAVCRATGRIAGYADASAAADEADIGIVCVDSEHRKKGVGSGLIRQLLALASGTGIKNVFLEVEENNLPAIRLYVKSGFRECGRRRDYYGNGRDAILYKRDL